MASNDAFQALRDLLAETAIEAIPAAEVAAARVFRDAARAAAPVQTVVNSRVGVMYDSGQLKRSINIIEGKDRSQLFVTPEMGPSPRRRRLFVGPEKKKGYYGFFLEKGHKTAGSKRVKRKSTSTTHSQAGVETSRTVPARPWFGPAIKGAESAALAAAERAFERYLRMLDSRK